MPTPFENAQLNLELFELRREPVLREARTWFMLEFTPESFAELAALAGGERNPSFRMVLGYWDMAASLVTGGAIAADAFLAAHGEAIPEFWMLVHTMAGGDRAAVARMAEAVARVGHTSGSGLLLGAGLALRDTIEQDGAA